MRVIIPDNKFIPFLNCRGPILIPIEMDKKQIGQLKALGFALEILEDKTPKVCKVNNCDIQIEECEVTVKPEVEVTTSVKSVEIPKVVKEKDELLSTSVKKPSIQIKKKK